MKLKTIQNLEKKCGCNSCVCLQDCLCQKCKKVEDYTSCEINCKYNLGDVK